MLVVTPWQVKQEPAFGRFAIAGASRKLARLCESEIGAGEYADVYQKAAATDKTPIAIVDQMNTENGQGRTRSRVGVQLNRALPSRGGCCGWSRDWRAAFSRERLPQKRSRA